MELYHATSPPPQWDHWLRAAPAQAGFGQSVFWADLLRQSENATPHFVWVQQHDVVVAQLLVAHRPPAPQEQITLRQQLGAQLGGQNRGWLHALHGPVFHHPPLAQAGAEKLLDWCTGLSREKKLRHVSFAGFHPPSPFQHEPWLAALFAARGFAPHPWATVWLSLEPDEDTLFKNMDHAARKAVNKCRREGLGVRWMETEEDFTGLYLATWAQASHSPLPPARLARLLGLWRHPGRGAHYQFAVALGPEGEPLATLGFVHWIGVATEVISAQLPLALERKWPAQDLLHWELFLRAKALGNHAFDLAGVSPDPANPKEAGIRRFKEKFGGAVLRLARFEKTSPPWWRAGGKGG